MAPIAIDRAKVPVNQSKAASTKLSSENPAIASRATVTSKTDPMAGNKRNMLPSFFAVVRCKAHAEHCRDKRQALLFPAPEQAWS